MNVLVSVTTCLHLPRKYENVCNLLQSVVQSHTNEDLEMVNTFLLVNEYSDPPPTYKTTQLQRTFPFLTVVNKEKHQKGQAFSLNTILDFVRSTPCKYWVHVEESWVVTRPFLREAVQFLESQPSIHQLQLYTASYYVNHTRTSLGGEKYAEQVALNSGVDVQGVEPTRWQDYSYAWPLFSLRPSVNRAEFLRTNNHLTFSTDPTMWPVSFELKFAKQWCLDGGNMAAVLQPVVSRQENHVSTYEL